MIKAFQRNLHFSICNFHFSTKFSVSFQNAKLIRNSFLDTDVHRKSLSPWRYAHSVFFVSAVICVNLRPIKFSLTLFEARAS